MPRASANRGPPQIDFVGLNLYLMRMGGGEGGDGKFLVWALHIIIVRYGPWRNAVGITIISDNAISNLTKE